MSRTTLTNNEVFELVTEMVAGAVSQQPGVLSIRSTDGRYHGSGEVIYKELLITVSDALFKDYLEQCQIRHGVYSMDGCDDVAWTTWTPWSKEDLARFAVHAPGVSFRHDNHAEFEEFAGELLEKHVVLRHVFDLYSLQGATNDIVFVLAPEHLEGFVEKMRAIRVAYPTEAVQFLQYTSEEDEPVFTDEDIRNLTELQKGRLFDPTTKKFVKPTD